LATRMTPCWWRLLSALSLSPESLNGTWRVANNISLTLCFPCVVTNSIANSMICYTGYSYSKTIAYVHIPTGRASGIFHNIAKAVESNSISDNYVNDLCMTLPVKLP
jgi:hypothetical protein